MFAKTAFNVAGTSNYQGRLFFLRKNDANSFLTIEREPKQGERALKVVAHTKRADGAVRTYKIGSVPAEKAKWLAYYIEQGKTVRVNRTKNGEGKPMPWTIGGGKVNIGAKLAIAYELIEKPAVAVETEAEEA